MNEVLNNHLTKSRKIRIEIINVLYKYELLEKNILLDKLFEEEKELSNEAFKKIEAISKNYNFFKEAISLFLNNNWQWNRISPLIRAILILAAFEMMIIDQPKIVINEAIEITKMYFDKDNEYKMVNAILENIYKYYLKNELLNK
ncbi:MAG: transcription antitermination protein NusB [Metamycoplasmataceae bacterium]